MSFLGGMISPALTVATQAAGAYQGASANAIQTQRQQIMQALMFAREAHTAEITNALHTAQAGLAGAQQLNTTREANAPHLGDSNYASSMGDVAGAQAAAKLPVDLQEMVAKGQMDRATAESVANIRNQGTLGAAGINAGSRIGAANIEQQGANTRQGLQIQSQKDLQKSDLYGQNQNRLQQIQEGQKGSVTTALGRDVGILPKPPTQQQTDWDNAAASLAPGTNPVQVLGARP